jgi:ribonuclease PH
MSGNDGRGGPADGAVVPTDRVDARQNLAQQPGDSYPMAVRPDHRQSDEIRPVRFVPDFQVNPLGSVLIEWGKTRVLCAVSSVPRVPRWMAQQNRPGGWLTAEYQMLPGSTAERTPRESTEGAPSGRTTEIQRLIGRSLRAVVDLERIGQRTLYVDCDVLDADGGTRCAAITGASVAVELALRRLFGRGDIQSWPMRAHVAAVSVGMCDGEPLLDLCYAEDSTADVDMNLILTAQGHFVEVQGTAEGRPYSRSDLDRMLDLGTAGASRLFALQQEALKRSVAS